MAVDVSVDKLVGELKQLRDDIARMTESFVGSARRQSGEAASRVRSAAEDTWSDAVHATADVARRIEDQPLVATAIAFGIGLLLGMLFLGRRR